MRRRRGVSVSVSAGAVLLLGVLYFILKPAELGALLGAAAVHELGHLAALALLGADIQSISMEACGLNIRCSALDGTFARCFAALSGPAAGVGLFFILRGAGWTLAAEVSLWLSIVNLLLVLPLDGGRALQAVLECVFGDYAAYRVLELLGFLLPLALMMLGLLALRAGYGATLVAFGGWILLLQPGISCKSHGNDVKCRYLD